MTNIPAPFIDGWEACESNQTDENPYSETLQPFSYRCWGDGWCARFSAEKHDLSLNHEDHYNPY